MNNRHGRVGRELSLVFSGGSVGNLTDGQLLERFIGAPDESADAAFSELVGRHGSMVLATCRSVLGDRHAAEDAFQVTFLVLARRAFSLHVKDSLGPWLHQVAYRTARCALSAESRRQRHERRAAEAAGPSVREDVRDEIGPILHREIERLPQRYRAVVLLCCAEGLTVNQAAVRLGWPAGTVQSRLARGRDRLRGRLLRLGLAPSASVLTSALMLESARAAVPSGLVNSLVRVASSVAAGRPGTAGMVSGRVITLMKGAMVSMLVTRLQGAAAVVVGVGLLGAGAAALARIDDPAGASAREGARPSYKFEIRVWKDGAETGPPVVVEGTGGTSYNVETRDAVISIRPRTAPASGDRRAEPTQGARLNNRLERAELEVLELQNLNERLKIQNTNLREIEELNRLESQQTRQLSRQGAGQPDAGQPGGSAEIRELRPNMKNSQGEGTRGQSGGAAPGQESRPGPQAPQSAPGDGTSSETERRLGRLEEKVDQLLRALRKPGGESDR